MDKKLDASMPLPRAWVGLILSTSILGSIAYAAMTRLPVMGVPIIALTLLVWQTRFAGLSWWQHYWENNVVGYRMWYLSDREGNVRKRILPRFEEPYEECAFAISIPLGGWLASPMICQPAPLGNVTRVEFAFWVLRVIAFVPESNLVTIDLTDHHGHKLRFNLERTCQLLAPYAHQANSVGWTHIVEELHREVARKEHARQVAETARLRQQEQAAVVTYSQN